MSWEQSEPLNLGIWAGEEIVFEAGWKKEGIFIAEASIWLVITVGMFCTASYSLIHCLQLQAAVNNSGLFCMQDSNQSTGLASVEPDGIGNYLGHLYSKEQSTGKEGTKLFWLSLVQCNPFYK